LHILDRKTLRTRATFCHQDSHTTNPFAASPDGAFVAGVGQYVLVVWEVATGRAVWQHDFEKEKDIPFSIHRLAFSPHVKTLAVGVQDEDVVRLHDARTGRELRRIANPEARYRGVVRALVYSPDGRSLAAGFAKESVIRIWDAATGKQLRCIKWEP